MKHNVVVLTQDTFLFRTLRNQDYVARMHFDKMQQKHSVWQNLPFYKCVVIDLRHPEGKDLLDAIQLLKRHFAIIAIVDGLEAYSKLDSALVDAKFMGNDAEPNLVAQAIEEAIVKYSPKAA
jgi:hypothetical protein